MTTQMVFLVGGMGTRLGARASGLPKPLQPVAGKPFLRHLIEDARRYGITRFLLLAGHLGQFVEECFAADADVTTLIEPAPLGTGGALRFATDDLDDTFLMGNGDSFFRFNLLDLARPPAAVNWLGKLALRHIAHADRYGMVELDGAVVRGFRERGEGGAGLINGGVYLLRREIVDLIGEGAVSLERDVFPALAQAGRLAGAVYDGPFLDIGVPDALDEAQNVVPAMRRRPALVITEHMAQDGAAVKRANDAGLYVYVSNAASVAKLNTALTPLGAHLDGVASDANTDPNVEHCVSLADAAGLDAALARFSG